MSDTTVLCVSILSGKDLLSGPDWIKVENSKTLIDVLVQVSGTRALGQQVQVVVSKEPSFTEAALVQVLNPVSLLDESRSIYVKFLLRSSVLSLKQSTDLKCKAERDTDIPLFHFLQREDSVEKFIKDSEPCVTASSKLNMPFESSYLNQIYMEQKLAHSTVAMSKQEIVSQSSVGDCHNFTTWQQQCEQRSHTEEKSKSETLISLSLDGLTKWTHSDSSSAAEVSVDSAKTSGPVNGCINVSDVSIGSTDMSSLQVEGKGGVNKEVEARADDAESVVKAGCNEDAKISSVETVTQESSKEKLSETGNRKSSGTKCVGSKTVLKSQSLSQQIKQPIRKPKLVAKPSLAEKKESRLGMPSLRPKATRRVDSSPPDSLRTAKVKKDVEKSKNPEAIKSCPVLKAVSKLKKPICPKKNPQNETISSRCLPKKPASCAETPPVRRTVSPAFSMSKFGKTGGKVKETSKKTGAKDHLARISNNRPLLASKKNSVSLKSKEDGRNNQNKSISNVHGMETEKGEISADNSSDMASVSSKEAGDCSISSNCKQSNANLGIDGSAIKPSQEESGHEPEAFAADSIEMSSDSKELFTLSLELNQDTRNCADSSSRNKVIEPLENLTELRPTSASAIDSNVLHDVAGREVDFSDFLQAFARSEGDFDTNRTQLLIDAVLRSRSPSVESSGMNVVDNNGSPVSEQDTCGLSDRETKELSGFTSEVKKNREPFADKDVELADCESEECFGAEKADFREPVVCNSPEKCVKNAGESASLNASLCGETKEQNTVLSRDCDKNIASKTSQNSLFFHGLLDDPLTRSLKDKYAAAQRQSSEGQQPMTNEANKSIKRTGSLNESIYGSSPKKSGFFDHLKERTIDTASSFAVSSDADDHVNVPAKLPQDDVTKSPMTRSLDQGSSDVISEIEASESILKVAVDREITADKTERLMNGNDKEKVEFLGEIGRDSKPNRTFTLDDEEDETVTYSPEKGLDIECKDAAKHNGGKIQQETLAAAKDANVCYSLNEHVVCHVRRKWSSDTGIMDQLLLSSLFDLTKNLSVIAARILDNSRKETSNDHRSSASSASNENSTKNLQKEDECSGIFKNLRKLEKKLLEIENNLIVRE